MAQAQVESLRPHGENTQRSPSSPTAKQLLRDNTSWPAATSPTLQKLHDLEEDHTHLHKKSVLAKVKEKAKKWRNTLTKKKHSPDSSGKPSWGVSLDDVEDHEQDAEYHGAPMYESEQAPEPSMGISKQHPKSPLIIAENHVVASSLKNGADKSKEMPCSPDKTIAKTVEKPAQVSTTNQTIIETVAEKRAPASTTEKVKNEYSAEKSAPVSTSMGSQGPTISASTTQAEGEGEGEPSPSNEQKYDKGVSVKEYLMTKLEPGEDEKALSRVITHAISPKKNPTEMGVVEKVKEAVSSLLWTEQSSPSTNTITTSTSSPSIPTSTNAHEANEEEESSVRILQAN